jgi:hypothetical protein
MRYARAGLDLKRQALTQVFSECHRASARAGLLVIDVADLVEWLRRLAKYEVFSRRYAGDDFVRKSPVHGAHLSSAVEQLKLPESLIFRLIPRYVTPPKVLGEQPADGSVDV